MNGHSILLVEDDAILRELTEVILSINGYQVRCAKNGLEAKQMLIDGDRPDLMLIDMLMPVMDGMQLLHWIRQEAEIDLPVLIVTALQKRDVEEEVLSLGVAGIINKPVDAGDLIKKVNSALLTP